MGLEITPGRHLEDAEQALDLLAAQVRVRDDLASRAAKEPLGVDISDYSDEFCAGFLKGQENAFDALAGDRG
jgi:hypothetical protein